ncbi:MAG: response regulator [Syntrophobacteria bacterium]
MEQVTQVLQMIPQENPEYKCMTTTLYELIEVINEELQPGEERLLERVMLDLAERQKIRFLENSPSLIREADTMARIFLVDDEEYIRRYYTDELRDEGYEVFTTASGHNLLKKIHLIRPDAVILDIRLVDQDGLELLQDIRKQYPDLPVILCTAYHTYKGEPELIAADYYVVKSFNLSELKTAIQRAIEAGRSFGKQ